MSAAEYQVHGEVAVITLNNPPVNGLGHALRSAIVDGVTRANDDASIKALVLIGAGKAFSGGADITEFGLPSALAEPNLFTVINFIEASDKPVIAAIHGVAMGGGLELALACRYRIAVDQPGTRMALPEVMLGIWPLMGGVMRLPRVVSPPEALDMMLTGRAIDARRAKRMGLVDEAVPPRIKI
ncbi:MAG: enoyl-CoA hydratase/isomerase family protein, partial [Dokdonella sp.]